MNEPAARPQPSGGPHESFAPGTYVLGGRYWIEGLIGQNAGSGSHVHRAVAVAGVPGAGLAQGDRVVIKVMPSADLKMAQDEYAFLRQAVDNWWDANVAQPVEVTLSGGGACIVTRYVSGDSLRGVLDRAPDGLEADRALRLAYSILNGLDVLHRVPRNKANHGVIHRDVKPENIIVTSPGTHDEKAVIIDLGIASTATKAFAAPLRATLPYASPEQLLSPGDVTVRSDLFAAAIVLYEMLCGARPFGRGVAQFVVGADGTAVEVPGLAGPAARSGEVGAINGFLRRALTLDPARRARSAEAMMKELRGIHSFGGGVVLSVGDGVLDLGSWGGRAGPDGPPPGPAGGPGRGGPVPRVPGPDPAAPGRGRTASLPGPGAVADGQHRTALLPGAEADGFGRPCPVPGPIPGAGPGDPARLPPIPEPDEYSRLIDASITGRRSADWEAEIGKAVARKSLETAREAYLDNLVCHVLGRIRGQGWLSARAEACASAAAPFSMTDVERRSLRNDQYVLELRAHMRQHDADVRGRAQADAARVSSRVTAVCGGALAVIVLFLIFWSVS